MYAVFIQPPKYFCNITSWLSRSLYMYFNDKHEGDNIPLKGVKSNDPFCSSDMKNFSFVPHKVTLPFKSFIIKQTSKIFLIRPLLHKTSVLWNGSLPLLLIQTVDNSY